MASLQDLHGKVAVVTGGAAGMGKGIAERLKAGGAQVVIADFERQALARTAEDLGILGIETDMRDYAAVKALAKTVLDRYGRIDILINNAGVGPLGLISELSLADWQWMLDVNLYGVIHGIHAFLPLLKANAEGGYIVNTASVSGLMTAPLTGPYAVSKFGVVAVSEVLAQELAQEGSRVGVSVLLPGPTKTEIATSSRNRPSVAATGLNDVRMEDTGLFEVVPWKTPLEIGDIVIGGMARGDLYIFTHAEFVDAIRGRHRAIEDAAAAAIARFSAA